MQFTQKEKMYLQDALGQERLCVTKYTNFANQVRDPEVSTLLRNIANREQQHVDTIVNLFQQAGLQVPQQ
ncbi:ferritin-like domain-containing protein [Thermovenabulum gondwanense]|uniref:Spore coat protein n=1 Tax=Thermovenabulum gondwanense TaxID=520767 RepID=A0A162N405_9FIRM|nr:ferritin-like domain-containing protein [Thermovenabulum gondwanense]KYO69179.1 hypothetical protein ATZ99_00520 [Thermovenabulum gondwanense]